MELNTVFFYLIALAVLSAAIYSVTSSKLLNAALALALSMFAVGGLFFMLGAPFLGVLQVLINAGAIPIVTVFIIFMTQSRRVKLRSQLNALVAVGAIVVFGASLWAFWNPFSKGAATQVRGITPTESQQLGFRLLSAEGVNGSSGTLLAFEIASVLLLIAMVGAIVLTKREGETIKGQVGVLSEVDKPVSGGQLERPAMTMEASEKLENLEKGVA
jgi:NADH-quinone oxidoreductase subunit J